MPYYAHCPCNILHSGGPGERLRAGQDQIRLIGPAMEKIRARAEAKKQGETIQQVHPINRSTHTDNAFHPHTYNRPIGIMLDQFRRGNNAEKAAGIELSAQVSQPSEANVCAIIPNIYLLFQQTVCLGKSEHRQRLRRQCPFVDRFVT